MTIPPDFPPFVITLFLADGIPEGLKTIQKSNWDGFGVAFPRSLFAKHRHYEKLNKPGVYLLSAQTELGNKLYVGEGDPIINRLESHIKDKNKDWFEEIIAFTVKDQNLHKAFIQFLESRLIKLARDSGRFDLQNGNSPTEPTLSEVDRSICEGFLKEMLLCLPVLGIHLNMPVIADLPNNSFYIKSKGIEAKGLECPEGFLIYKDSIAVSIKSETTSIPSGVINLRKQLLEKGILSKIENGNLIFTQDYLFSSPSTASAVILGSSSNGRDAWKTSTGISLKTIQTAQ